VEGLKQMRMEDASEILGLQGDVNILQNQMRILMERQKDQMELNATLVEQVRHLMIRVGFLVDVTRLTNQYRTTSVAYVLVTAQIVGKVDGRIHCSST